MVNLLLAIFCIFLIFLNNVSSSWDITSGKQCSIQDGYSLPKAPVLQQLHVSNHLV